MSNLVISLFNYNNDYSCMVMEEETEKGENEEFEPDDQYVFSHKPEPAFVLPGMGHLPVQDASFPVSYSHKPETPPPNFC